MLFSTFHVVSLGITHFYHVLAYRHNEIQKNLNSVCQLLHSAILGRDASVYLSSLSTVPYNQEGHN